MLEDEPLTSDKNAAKVHAHDQFHSCITSAGQDSARRVFILFCLPQRGSLPFGCDAAYGHGNGVLERSGATNDVIHQAVGHLKTRHNTTTQMESSSAIQTRNIAMAELLNASLPPTLRSTSCSAIFVGLPSCATADMLVGMTSQTSIPTVIVTDDACPRSASANLICLSPWLQAWSAAVCDVIHRLQWNDVILVFDYALPTTRLRELVDRLADIKVASVLLPLNKVGTDISHYVMTSLETITVRTIVLCVDAVASKRLLQEIREGVGVMADLEWLVACPGPGQDVLHDLVARNPKVVSMVPLRPGDERLSTTVSTRHSLPCPVFPQAEMSVFQVITAMLPFIPPTTVSCSVEMLNSGFCHRNGTINAELLSAWTSQAHQSGFALCSHRHLSDVEWEMALPFVRNISSNGTEAFEGLCIDLINALAEELKFTYQLVAPGDGLFGAPEPDGSWNGMVGMVKRGEADMAIGPFTITSIRETVVDFTVPYMEDGGGILTLRKDPNPDLMRMFAPFTTTIWLATGGMVLLFGLVLFFINRFSPYSRQARGGGEASWNVAVSVWIIFSSFMEQGAVKQPRSTSARMVLGCWWVFTVLILSIYTATLAAMLTVTLEPDVIDSIDEVLASDVTPLTLTGTNWDTLFATADTGVYKQIGQRMEAGPDIRDISDAMSHVLKGGAAFLYDISQLDYLYKQDCQNLHLAKKVFNANGLGFVLPENAPYKQAFNNIILKLQEGGFVEMWRQRWWRGSRQCGGQQQLASLGLGKRLDVVSLAGILFLYGGVVLLCVVVQLAARSGALGRLSDLGRLAGAHVAHPFRHVQGAAGRQKPAPRQ
ncbi:hypothetical protein BaRGS_00010273 [Batillaria attramentaria]|uniref:Glutamate receptor n=1 Tax=Batillaria attramentaria TaxID=370345 RepID=A0ABD0LHA6_9CAEN